MVCEPARQADQRILGLLATRAFWGDSGSLGSSGSVRIKAFGHLGVYRASRLVSLELGLVFNFQGLLGQGFRAERVLEVFSSGLDPKPQFLQTPKPCEPLTFNTNPEL